MAEEKAESKFFSILFGLAIWSGLISWPIGYGIIYLFGVDEMGIYSIVFLCVFGYFIFFAIRNAISTAAIDKEIRQATIIQARRILEEENKRQRK